MSYLVEYQKLRNLSPDGIVGKRTANIMMTEFNISSIIQFCHFIAQTEHESRAFFASRENLNYSAISLRKYFNKYLKPGEEYTFAYNPERIANRVYAYRGGNRDEASGDGWKYRGGGSIQITFKNNWLDIFRRLGVSDNTSPDNIITPEYYFKIADIYFDMNNVWKYCTDITDNSILNVSRKINLGTTKTNVIPNGYNERKILTLKYYKTLAT